MISATLAWRNNVQLKELADHIHCDDENNKDNSGAMISKSNLCLNLFFQLHKKFNIFVKYFLSSILQNLIQFVKGKMYYSFHSLSHKSVNKPLFFDEWKKKKF